MPVPPIDALLLLAGLLLTVAPLYQAETIRASGAGITSWVPVALLSSVGLATFIFGLFKPELIAAILGQS